MEKKLFNSSNVNTAPSPSQNLSQNSTLVSSAPPPKTKIKKYLIIGGLILVVVVIFALAFKYLKNNKSANLSQVNNEANLINSSTPDNSSKINSSSAVPSTQIATPPAIPRKVCSVASSTALSRAILLVVFNQAPESELNNLIKVFTKNNFAIDSLSDTENIINLVKVDNSNNDCNQIQPTANSETIDPNKYQAVVFAGGPSVLVQGDNPKWSKLANDFYQANKIVAADLSGVGILAKAGLLKDKNITIPLGQKDQLAGSGAIYQESSPVVDGRIVTGSNIMTVDKFAETVVETIK